MPRRIVYPSAIHWRRQDRARETSPVVTVTQSAGAGSLPPDSDEGALIPGAEAIASTHLPWRPVLAVPDAFGCWAWLSERLRTGQVVAFLDFDGSLAPIAEHPEAAWLPDPARAAVTLLSRSCPVVIISGRDVADVRQRVGNAALWYAGNHGFELSGPGGVHYEQAIGRTAAVALRRAARGLRARLHAIRGVLVEPKEFGVAVHYRGVAAADIPAVIQAVETEALLQHDLRVTHNKQVVELVPDVRWDKGMALHWILAVLEVDPRLAVPLVAGDDVTDEDAFRALTGSGVAVLVRDVENAERWTSADVAVEGPEGLVRLLDQLPALLAQ